MPANLLDSFGVRVVETPSGWSPVWLGIARKQIGCYFATNFPRLSEVLVSRVSYVSISYPKYARGIRESGEQKTKEKTNFVCRRPSA